MIEVEGNILVIVLYNIGTIVCQHRFLMNHLYPFFFFFFFCLSMTKRFEIFCIWRDNSLVKPYDHPRKLKMALPRKIQPGPIDRFRQLSLISSFTDRHSALWRELLFNVNYSQFLAATKQLYEWYFLSVCLSVCPSVRLSVRHTFLTMFPSSYRHEIFRSYHHGPG